MNLLEEIKDIIYDYLGDDTQEIGHGTRFAEDLGLSSLDLVTLLARIEDEFRIRIEDSAAVNIKTVGDLLHCVGKLL